MGHIRSKATPALTAAWMVVLGRVKVSRYREMDRSIDPAAEYICYITNLLDGRERLGRQRGRAGVDDAARIAAPGLVAATVPHEHVAVVDGSEVVVRKQARDGDGLGRRSNTNDGPRRVGREDVPVVLLLQVAEVPRVNQPGDLGVLFRSYCWVWIGG